MEDLIKKYGKSTVTRSPHIQIILEKYNLLGRTMSLNKFYTGYVHRYDSGITKRQWGWFIKKYIENVEIKAEKIVALAEDRAVTDNKLEDKSIRNIYTIATLTLEELVKNPERLTEIPVEMRMKWMFEAMKARDSRANVYIKKKDVDRKQNVYEDMIKSAQYGDAIEGEEDEEEAEETDLPAGQAGEPNPEKEFNPEEFENEST
jgi:hypothetical protein